MSYVDGATSSIQTSYSPYTGSILIPLNLAAEQMPNTNSAGGPGTMSSALGGTATVTYAQTMYGDKIPYHLNKAD